MHNSIGPRWRWALRRLTHPYPGVPMTAGQRRGMTMLWLDNFVASLSTAFYADFEVLYLVALGATSAIIGTRASINSGLSLVAPLLGAWLVASSGLRKRWVLWGGGGLGRLTILLMAFIPLLFSGQNAVIAFIALTALSVAAGNISVPAGSSLFGDVVPVSIRGRFMGLQMMTANIVKVGAIPLAGLMIAAIGGIPGYQVAFGVTALIGFVATSFYARIPEPRGAEGRAAQGQKVDFGGGLRRMMQDRGFVFFCLINFVWTLGIQSSAPFFTVHMVQDLHFGVGTISLLATTTTIVNVVAVRLAGNLIDRHGPARITALGMLLVPLMPLAWSLAYTPLTVGIVRAYGVIAWAGVQVAATPLMLRITPPEYRSQFIAIFNTINGLAAILGPIPGGYIYATFGFNTVLYISAAVRGLGALLYLVLFVRSFHRVDTAPEGERAAA